MLEQKNNVCRLRELEIRVRVREKLKKVSEIFIIIIFSLLMPNAKSNEKNQSIFLFGTNGSFHGSSSLSLY